MRQFKNILLTVLFLFIIVGCKKEENPIVPEEHFEAEGLYLLNNKSDTVVYYFQGKFRATDTLSVTNGNYGDDLSVRFLDATGKSMNPQGEEADGYSFDWAIADTSKAKAELLATKFWDFKIFGKKVGQTTIELQMLHLGHVDFRTIPVPLKVK